MRYVIAWKTANMTAPAFWYYDVGKDGKVTCGNPHKVYDLMTLAGEVMTFVKDGLLVYFRPAKEDDRAF